MILIAHVINLILLIINLILVLITLANPTYFDDTIPLVIMLLAFNTAFGILTVISVEKPWDDL